MAQNIVKFKPKVLLVCPKFEDSYWGFQRALKFEGKRCAFPPLGLLTISSMLPENWEQRLVDENVHKLTNADIAWADLVFVTGMLVQKDAIHKVISRSKFLGKTVVLGGPYISTSVEKVPGADHIFIGEAEETLKEFTLDFVLGEAKPRYESANKPELSLTPKANFSLINPNDYGAMMVQYSRGCPFSCEFCDIIEIYGRVPRTKSNAQLLADFDTLYDMGWRGPVFIVDDNFIGNKKNVRLLMPDLIQWQQERNYPFSLFTEASVNLAEDIKLLEAMQAARFQRVFLGIETPVEESLAFTQKKQNTHGNLLEAVKTIQSYGMEVMAGFIVGFDTDPDDIADKMIAFINDSAVIRAMVGMLQALPDTQLWRRLHKEGRLIDDSWGDIGERPNFIPKMDIDKLMHSYQRIRETIYSSPNYYRRVLDHFSRMPGPNTETSALSPWRKFKAAARIIATIGLWEKDRLEFWRFIKRTYQQYPDRLGQAFAFAANGYHFRKLLPKGT